MLNTCVYHLLLYKFLSVSHVLVFLLVKLFQFGFHLNEVRLELLGSPLRFVLLRPQVLRLDRIVLAFVRQLLACVCVCDVIEVN